ncbi:MAG: YdbH domain-containing protein, partial [Alphaproteobacteria bacterium]
TPAGAARLELDGTARGDAEGGLEAELGLRLDGDMGGFAGTLSAVMDSEGAVGATLTVTEGAIRHEIATLAGLTGTLGFEGSPDGVDRLSAAFEFTSLDAAGTAFEPGRFELRFDEGVAEAEASLAWPEGRLSLHATGDPSARPLGVHVTAEGAFDGAMIQTLLPDARVGGGRATFGLGVELHDALALTERRERSPAEWLALAAIDGTLEIALEELALEGLGRAGALQGRVTLASAPDGLVIKAPDGLLLEGLRPDATRLEALPEPAAALLSTIDRLKLSDGERTPFQLFLDLGSGQAIAHFTTTLEVAAEGLAVEGELIASAALAPDLRPRAIGIDLLVLAPLELDAGGIRLDAVAALSGFEAGLTEEADTFTLDELVVAIERLDAQDMSLEGHLVLGELTGDRESASGTLALQFEARGEVSEDIAFDGFFLDLTCRVERTGERLAIEPLEGEARLRRGELAGGYVLSSPAVPLIAAESRVAYDLATGGLEHRITLAPFTARIHKMEAGEEVETARLGVERLELEGASVEETRLHLQGARLVLPAYAFALENIEAEGAYTPASSRIDLKVARLEHLAEPPFLTPLGAQMTAAFGEERLTFRIEVFEPLGALKLTLEGDHDLGLREGSARLALEPIRFAKGYPQPADLFPIARGLVDAVEGTITLEGAIAWRDGELEPDLRLGVEDLNATIGETRLYNVQAALTLDGLTPPTTPPGQRISGLLTSSDLEPMPIEVRFRLQPDGVLLIEEAELGFAGGRLTTVGARLEPTAREGRLVIDVASIDLARLIELIDLEGLSGTGRLSGTVPVAFVKNGIEVRGGRLAAAGPGVLRYAGSEVEQVLEAREDTVGLMIQALSDFHYEELTLALDKEFSGDGTVLVHMKGSNPAVLEGYPFVFNINFSSNFDRLAALIRDALATAESALKLGIEGVNP